MGTDTNRLLDVEASARLHLRRAEDAVDTAAAELDGAQLAAATREEFSLEAAGLIGKVELLLSLLRQEA